MSTSRAQFGSERNSHRRLRAASSKRQRLRRLLLAIAAFGAATAASYAMSGPGRLVGLFVAGGLFVASRKRMLGTVIIVGVYVVGLTA
jgi:hypothetical protein